MRLDQLTLTNFRCYKDKTFNFHPNVNLIVGQNATGKTAILDAITIAMGTWLLGFNKKTDSQNILKSDATNHYVERNGSSFFIEQWPVTISAQGHVNNQSIQWQRTKGSATGTTRHGQSIELIELAKQANDELITTIDLPLISYYGTMRLWHDPKRAKTQPNLHKKDKPSRLDGYKFSVDPRISVKTLVQWFAKQEWQAFKEKQIPTMLAVVRKAVLANIENAKALEYDAEREELLLTIAGNDPQPFSLLSDGQRSLLALVADIAQKAITLNPHLGEKTLELTQGIVLIDELDLHLHPRWQRSVIENLRTIFPKIQFICTTHSPFLIQSLRSSEELIMLDGEPSAAVNNKSLEDIAVGIMSVNQPQVSQRYEAMKSKAIEYLAKLQKTEQLPSEKLEQYKQDLADSIAPYADNPAYQAFLEMHRVAKLGG